MRSTYNAGFRQSCDATCGPASMILVAKGFDLETKEESAWQNSLFQRWLPVNEFLTRGMALHELQLITELIFGDQIEIILRRAYPENHAFFLDNIQRAFCSEDTIVIVNYRQNDFITTTHCDYGNPHYSPIVDYNKEENKVLIADVDNQVQAPYWVSIDAMFQSMNHRNPALNIPRGWLMIRKRVQ